MANVMKETKDANAEWTRDNIVKRQTEEEAMIERKRQRTLRNRESAQASRTRQKAYVISLEATNYVLKTSNNTMALRLSQLEQQNAELLQQMQILQENMQFLLRHQPAGFSAPAPGISNSLVDSRLNYAAKSDISSTAAAPALKTPFSPNLQVFTFDASVTNDALLSPISAAPAFHTNDLTIEDILNPIFKDGRTFNADIASSEPTQNSACVPLV